MTVAEAMARSGSRSGRASKRRAAALLLAMLTLMVVAVPMLPDSDVAEGDGGQHHDVTYHEGWNGQLLNSDGAIDPALTVDGSYNQVVGGRYEDTYHGSFVSTEYNPQVWEHDVRWYPIMSAGYSTDGVGRTLVFTGWAYYRGVSEDGTPQFTDRRYPGEVMSEQEMADATQGERIHVYATWGYMTNYGHYTAHVGQYDWRTGDEFTNIVAMNSDGNLSRLANTSVGVTVRGVEDNARLMLNDGRANPKEFVMTANLIIDSIGIVGTHSANHGDSSGGIYANGHVLVIGSGVSAAVTSNGAVSVTGSFTQVFGGSRSSDIGSGAGMVRTPYGASAPETFSTFTIIHSGTFGNVVAGSNGHDIDGSTYLVVKDVSILDTLVGGSSGSSANTIDGSTYTYASGLWMYGDTYDEGKLGNTISADIVGPYGFGQSRTVAVPLTESSIMTGGSNNGTITEDSHVFISGDSSVWDVQGGGRRGTSSVMTATVEISGNALVRHVVCGSITDGLMQSANQGSPGTDAKCVDDVVIRIRDGARAASVFGAGYDTYYSAAHASMMDGGSISISIEDSSVVGYVYGGGYRGTIGTPQAPIDSISISITGGTVLHDVFGGGRGGVDKVLHSADGTNITSDRDHIPSISDTTGHSRVYAGSVSISVSGGRVGGSVYGGGESVPVLEGGYRASSGGYQQYGGSDDGVASLEAESISIRVTGGTIVGSVFGAGKGVSFSDGREYDKPAIIAMDGSGSVVGIEWFSGSDSLGYAEDADYGRFAEVTVDQISIYFEGYLSGGDTGSRDGSVYGGGEVSRSSVRDDVDITVRNSTIADAIFGGGMGVEGDVAPGTMSALDVSIVVTGTTTVGGGDLQHAIFGGGRTAYTSVGDRVLIDLEGPDAIVRGDVHGGALGSDGASPVSLMDGDRIVVLNGAKVFGNIYGGGRLGQDGSPDGPMHGSTVALVSGMVTQSVYGGGFQGQSYMDSRILVGSPAAEYAHGTCGISPCADRGGTDLWIGSVFGGGNLNGAGEAYAQSLLRGSAEIEVAMEYDPAFPQYALRDGELRIDGDIFGQGNFSTIDGRSVVHVHGYDMADGHSMRSIQRADELHIVDSSLSMTGSSDGGQTGLSERFSINRVGLMQLDGSRLDLYAETSRIDDYYSMADGILAEAEDCLRQDGRVPEGNEIVLHNGRMFSLAWAEPGEGGVSSHAGVVHGYTLLSKPSSDTYYGVFATGSAESGSGDPAGFMVLDGTEEASTVTSGGITTWYLAGHLTLGEVITYGNGDGEQTLSFILPRIYQNNTTVYTYIGSYVDSEVQGGLYVTGEPDFERYLDQGAGSDDPGRMYFSMRLGGSVDVMSHEWGGSDWTRVYQDDPVQLGTSNTLELSTRLLSPYSYGPDAGATSGTAGSIGEVTIHLTESIRLEVSGGVQYVPVNMVDIQLTMHVRPVYENLVDLVVTIMTTGSGSSSKGSGRGYIDLPGTGSDPVSYTVVGVEGLEQDDDVWIWSDTTHLGLSGWTVINYTESNPCRLDGFVQGSQVYLGDGGIRDTTIAVDYTGGEGSFTIRLADDNGHSYNVTVNVRGSAPVMLDVAFEPLPADGDYDETMHLAHLGNGTIKDPYRFSWVTSDAAHGMEVPYGAVLSEQSVYFYSSQGALRHGTLQQAMEDMLDRLVYLTDGGDIVPFNYRDNLNGWYIDSALLTRYDMDSRLKEDMTLNASFGVTVTFHGNGVTVSPQRVVLRPGQTIGSLYLNIGEDPAVSDKVSIWSVGSGSHPVGHHLQAFADGSGELYSWAVPGPDGEWEPYSFRSAVFADLDLYLPWVPDTYDVTIEIRGPNNDGFAVLVDGNPVDVTFERVGGSFIGAFEAQYGQTVTVRTGGHLFESAAVTPASGVSGIGTTSVSFRVPDAGDTCRVEVAATVVEGHSITVEFVGSVGADLAGGSFIHVVYGGESKDISAGATSVTFIDTGDVPGGVVISLAYHVAGSASSDAMTYFTVQVSGDGSGFVTLDGGLRGKYRGDVDCGPIGGDMHVRVSLSQAVHLGSVGEGISSVAVGGQAVNEGDILFEGETVTIAASEGFYLPPVSHTGATQVDGGRYVVTGAADVSFGDLRRSAVTIAVSVTLLDLDGRLLAGSHETAITVTIDGTPHQAVIGWDGSPVTVEFEGIPADRSGYEVSVSAGGFVSGGAANIPDEDSVAYATLTLREFRIIYHATDGGPIGNPDDASLTSWDILRGDVSPYCLVGGSAVTATGTVDDYHGQIWFRGSPGGDQRLDDIATSLDLGLFSSGELHLFAIPTPEGGSGTHTTVSMSLVINQSATGGTLYNVNLFDEDVTFVATIGGETLAVVYDAYMRSIVIPAGISAGTGAIVLDAVTGTSACRLTIHVVTNGGGAVMPMLEGGTNFFRTNTEQVI